MTLGSLDQTQLDARFYRNWHWWRWVFKRYSWACWCKVYRDYNYRCWCPVGWAFDGQIVLAGFGVTWWLSHYGGQVPCCCDDAIEELEATP